MTLSGWEGAGHVDLFVVSKPGGTISHGTPAFWKSGDSTGGAGKIQWNAAALPAATVGLYVALSGTISNNSADLHDRTMMRSGMTLIGTGYNKSGVGNQTLLGKTVSTSAALASATTDKLAWHVTTDVLGPEDGTTGKACTLTLGIW
jgi:hypothetical protein